MSDTAGPTGRRDQRSSPRRPLRLLVRLWNDELEANAYTSDVSDDGMLVECARQLDPGTRLHVEVRVQDTSYFTEAIVARRQRYPQYAQSYFKPAVGVRFLGLTEALHQDPPGEAAVSSDAPPSESRAVAQAETASLPPEDPSLAVDLRRPERLRELFDRDLSKGALLIRTDPAPELGSRLCVALRLPPPHGDIPVQGEVVSIFAGQVGLLLAQHRELARRLTDVLGSLS